MKYNVYKHPKLNVHLAKLKNIKGLPFYHLRNSPERLYSVVNLRIINYLRTVYNLQLTVGMKEYKDLSLHINTIFKTRGNMEGIKWVKEARLALMKFLEGNPLKKSSILKLNKHGLPWKFGIRINNMVIEDNNFDDLKLLLTILNSSRALSLGKVADTLPITTPLNKGSSYEEVVKDMSKYTQSFWLANGFGWKITENKLPRKLRFRNFHFTTKTGPNGHALWTCLLDLISISSKSILNDIIILGGDRFKRKIDLLQKFHNYLIKLFPEWFNSKSLNVYGLRDRKISHFPDKEFKVRVIAVGDYFSQTVLKPFHKWLFKFLSNIPQDHTHNQGGFKTLLVDNYISNGNKFVSADLTAATDRFPIEIISLVLKGRLPSGWVDAWQNVMVKEPFHYENKMLKYEVGNPMGFYSSWASFSVTHHFIIYYLCQINSIDWRTCSYALLGDDIVINNDIISKGYINIMKTLGVEVNDLKTHHSNHFFEFAKRLFYKSKEITPFPISSLQETNDHYYLIVNTLMEIEKRGWVPVEGIPAAITAFYKTVLHRKSNNCLKLGEASWGVEGMIKVMQDRLPGGQFLTELAARHNYKIVPPLTDSEAGYMLSNVAVELFADSSPLNDSFKQKSKFPLGELAVGWVEKLTGLCNDVDCELIEEIFELIQSIPQLRGYGTVEETYMNLVKQAKRIDTVEQGNWPKILRTMALPLDDRIFVQRTSHLIAKGAMLVSKQMLPRFEMLLMYPGLR